MEYGQKWDWRKPNESKKKQKRGLINGLILFSKKEKKGITIRRKAGNGTQWGTADKHVQKSCSRRKDYLQMFAEQKNTQRLNEKF